MNHHEWEKLKCRKASRWLFKAILNWLIIITVIAVALKIHHAVVYALAIFIIGTRQHAIAILGHDGGHRLVSSSRKLNDFLTATLALWPMGMTLTGYRKFHFAHHKYVGTKKDPELKHKTWSSPEWQMPQSNRKATFLLLKDMLGFSAMELISLMRLVYPPRHIMLLGPVSFISSIWILLLWSNNAGAILLWYASLCTSFWAVFRLRAWIEHMGTPGTHRIHLSLWQRLIYAPENTWYHWEHHRWPSIPFWQLPNVRKLHNEVPVIEQTKLQKFYRESPLIPSGETLRDLNENTRLAELKVAWKILNLVSNETQTPPTHTAK